jgi:hypothetical protein
MYMIKKFVAKSVGVTIWAKQDFSPDSRCNPTGSRNIKFASIDKLEVW